MPRGIPNNPKPVVRRGRKPGAKTVQAQEAPKKPSDRERLGLFKAVFESTARVECNTYYSAEAATARSDWLTPKKDGELRNQQELHFTVERMHEDLNMPFGVSVAEEVGCDGRLYFYVEQAEAIAELLLRLAAQARTLNS